MSKPQAWKDRRDAALPARKERARRALFKAGIDILEETPHSFIVKIGCGKVEYFPFTGGFRGKGIPPGSRGLRNLIALKKGH